jgi:hypothetical protein
LLTLASLSQSKQGSHRHAVYFVVPNALKAGAASVAERRGKDSEGSMEKFAVEGGGKGTKFWHQTAAVAFVLLMTVGVTLHVWLLLKFLVANLPDLLDSKA